MFVQVENPKEAAKKLQEPTGEHETATRGGSRARGIGFPHISDERLEIERQRAPKEKDVRHLTTDLTKKTKIKKTHKAHTLKTTNRCRDKLKKT